jgi:hypothetical protein
MDLEKGKVQKKIWYRRQKMRSRVAGREEAKGARRSRSDGVIIVRGGGRESTAVVRRLGVRVRRAMAFGGETR